MKTKSLLLLAAATLPLLACNENKEENAKELVLDTFEKKASYSIGVGFANNVRANEFAFDPEAFSQAIADVKAGGELMLSEDEMHATMQTFQTVQRELAMKEFQKIAGNKPSCC